MKRLYGLIPYSLFLVYMGLAPNGCGRKYRKTKIKLCLTNFSYKLLQLTNSKKYDIIYIEK